jgi:hypothetical protein
MKILIWLRHELVTVLLATLYFSGCFLVAELLKFLVLEDYGIAVTGITTALVLALVTAKVVVLLGKAPLGHRIGLVEVALRSFLYTAAALGLMLLEKAFSTREAAGGFAPALRSVLEHPEMPRIWAAVICVGFAFAGYTAFAVLRREIGAPPLAQAFLGAPQRTGMAQVHR